MTSRLVLVVSMWVKAGQEEAFEVFERKVAVIMADFGGRVESVVRRSFSDGGEVDTGSGSQQPFEIHVVSFPDRESFDRYRGDSRTQALAGEREEIVARTEVFEGRFGAAYS